MSCFYYLSCFTKPRKRLYVIVARAEKYLCLRGYYKYLR